MPKTAEKLVALKPEQLPQYLASLGLNPYQITIAIYGLFKEVKISGTLTPLEDNAVHIDKAKLLKMAKDPLLEASLCSILDKVQKTKNWEPLFQKSVLSHDRLLIFCSACRLDEKLSSRMSI